MSKLSLSDVKVGMVLQRPILNAQGGLLINKGMALDEKHIKLLRVWGITTVYVESEDDEAVKVSVKDAYDKACQEIHHVFLGHGSDAILHMIKQTALKQMKSEIEEGL